MKTEKLTIKSNVSDYTGTWLKEDVEAEMLEVLGTEPETETSWMNYVFEHALAECDDDNVLEAVDAAVENDAIRDLKLKTSAGDWISITKHERW